MSPESRQKQSRLGKGLSALIGEMEGAGLSATAVETAAEIVEYNIGDIKPNPLQPRRSFDEQDLEELKASISEHGVLQPIMLRLEPGSSDRYQIVAGERRWRAAKMAGLKTIPAWVRDVDELQILELGIIENVQRTDLNPIEEAEAYGALMKRFGRTQDSLAQKIGKSRVHIANTLRLLNLSDTARDHVRHGRISAGHARAALGAPDPDLLIERAIAQKLSVRAVETQAKLLRDDRGQNAVANTDKSAKKDVDTQALEADLARVLGLSVDIAHSKSGGQIKIKYRNLEQLDDLCRRLTARQS